MKKLLPLTLFALLLSCDAEQESVIPDTNNAENWSQEISSDMNAQFAKEENEEIQLFLDRYPDWDMTKTGTGLQYMIYMNSEKGDSVAVGDVVLVDFEISLLDGTICYSSTEKGPESFMVEKTDIESGLHEGVKYMKTGDRAKFILPSHMAHGLVGDQDKIPPLSTVIYDINLLNVQKNEAPKD